MTNHQKILQTVIQNLDESSRLTFIKEIFASLPPEQRQALLHTWQSSPEKDPITFPPERQIDLEAVLPSVETTQTVSDSDAMPETDWQTLLEKAQEPSPHANPGILSDAALEAMDPEKSKKVKSALNQFEQLKQIQAMDQKKSFRKEALSCFGLALLGLGVIVLASLGLKYVWQLFAP